jgi:hypothetical protein
MARRVFYSFHYDADSSRAAQVRNMGAVEGNSPATDNDWESIKGRGDAAIRNWIDAQLNGKSCSVVLIGANTAGRKWINYEIKASWDGGKGLVGIHVHNLKDLGARQSTQGANPFDGFTVHQTQLSSIVKAHNPPYYESKQVYGYIRDNLPAWIDEAVAIRGKY